MKNNNIETILRKKPLVIDLGCGKKKRAGSVGIDQFEGENVDIVADIEKGLDFLPDGSVDEVHSRSVLEHLDNLEVVLKEILRVLKPSCKAYVSVPHFSNPHYYSDYTHKRFFGLYTFYYFVDPAKQMKRKVPDFYNNFRVNIISCKLKFRSNFAILKPIKKLFLLMANNL